MSKTTAVVDLSSGFSRRMEVARRQYRCEPEGAWRLWEARRPPAAPYYLVRPESPTARAFWLQVDELGLPQATRLNRVVHLRDVTEALSDRFRRNRSSGR